VERQRRATAADIAREAGVSRATVGFVLNATRGQTISDGTRQRVLDAALRLGYRPNSAARALARGRSDTVLLVLPDWPMDFSLRWFVEEISAQLTGAGYALVTWTPDNTGRARPLWESLDADLVMSLAPFDAEQLAALRANGVTRILPDPADDGRYRPGRGVVGALVQLDHLHELGHRRLAYAEPADRRRAALAQERWEAITVRAAELGLPELTRRVVDHQDGSAEQAVRDWLVDGRTGVIAYNDDVAAAVVGTAIRAGVAVPAQLSVVGHDDSPLASMFLPALSSARLDVGAFARELAGYALAEIEGRSVPLDLMAATADLIVRESTAPPR
jgi:DNA-binding LacI/PurR family transcriptional regulator